MKIPALRSIIFLLAELIQNRIFRLQKLHILFISLIDIPGKYSDISRESAAPMSMYKTMTAA